MKKYVVLTEYDCLVKHSLGEELIDSNSRLSFDSPEKIIIYPLRQNHLTFPFTIDLSANNKSRFYKKFLYNSSEIFYICSPNKICNQVIEKVETKKAKVSVYIEENHISFENQSIKKTFAVEEKFTSYQIGTLNNLIILHLFGSPEQMWVFNSETGDLNFFSGKKIELVGDQVLLSKDVTGLTPYTVYSTYSLKDDSPKKLHERIKYDSDTPNTVTLASLVPIAFLEALKIGDFNLAKSYLSENLETTSEHMEKYFGKFRSILPIDENVYSLEYDDSFRIFEFKLDELKIVEISEIE